MIAEAAYVKLQPRISEKSYGQSEGLNTYVFEVPTAANKLEVKTAVEKQFKVSVTSVRTANVKGKPKVSNRKRRQPKMGHRADTKKAYVTLKTGDKIKIFEEGK